MIAENALSLFYDIPDDKNLCFNDNQNVFIFVPDTAKFS